MNENGQPTHIMESGNRTPRSANRGGKRTLVKEPESRVRPPAGRGGKRLAKPSAGGKPPRRGLLQSLKERFGLKEKRWRRLSKKELLILLIPAAAAVIGVAVVALLSRDAMRYPIGAGACQYYGGSAYQLREGAVLRRTSEDETLLMEGKENRKMNSLPIYFEDQQVVTIPDDMVYYAPRSGSFGRLPYFTELHYTSGGSVEAVREGARTNLERGFLYDGGDFYLFLEPVVISFNGYQIALPAMSYVEAVYTGDVMVFNYASKEFLLEAPTGAVTARIETGDYTISLLGDSMTTADGTKTLLFNRAELLDPVF